MICLLTLGFQPPNSFFLLQVPHLNMQEKLFKGFFGEQLVSFKLKVSGSQEEKSVKLCFTSDHTHMSQQEPLLQTHLKFQGCCQLPRGLTQKR